MSTLIEELPGEISRLEAKYGADNQFVKDLKEQLRASKATLGKTAQEVYRMQAVPMPKQNSAHNAPETEADGLRAGALRVAKYKHQNEQFRKK